MKTTERSRKLRTADPEAQGELHDGAAASKPISRKLISAVHEDLKAALEYEGAPLHVEPEDLERLPLSSDSPASPFLGTLVRRMRRPSVPRTATSSTAVASTTPATTIVDDDESALVRLIGRGKKKRKLQSGAAAPHESGHDALGIYVRGPTGVRSIVVSTGPVYSLAFRPDGKMFATGCADSTVRYWNAASGDPVGEPFTGRTRAICTVAFSTDGQVLAAGSFDGKIEVIAHENRHFGPLAGHGATFVRKVLFIPDPPRQNRFVKVGDWGSLISAGNDRRLREWEIASMCQKGTEFLGHTGDINALAVTPNAEKIVSGSSDKTLRVWNRGDHKQLGDPIPFDAEVDAISIHPANDTIAVVAGMKLTILSLETRLPVVSGLPLGEARRGDRKTYSIAHSPDGQVIAIQVGRSVELRHAETGELLRAPIQDEAEPHGLNSVVWSPDGRTLLTSGQGGEVRLYSFDEDAPRGENP